MAENVTAVIAGIAAFAAIGSFVVYTIQAVFNRKQVKASLDQVIVSRKQVDISQEQIRAMWRPLLLPFEPEKQEDSSQDVIKIRNVGTGPALNIRGVIFGHKPDHPDDEDSFLKQFRFTNPLPPKDPPVNATDLQERLRFRGDYKIGDQQRTYVFYAPRRTLEEENKGIGPIVQRLTFTYHDITGLKYASIFDRTRGSWKLVAFFPNILKDIDDIEHETG